MDKRDKLLKEFIKMIKGGFGVARKSDVDKYINESTKRLVIIENKLKNVEKRNKYFFK